MLVVRYGAGEWGVGEVWFQDGVPVWHELPTHAIELRPPQGRGGSSAPTKTLPRPDSRPGDESVPELARRFARYFHGDEVSFDDVEVDLDEYTPLQRALAAAI